MTQRLRIAAAAGLSAGLAALLFIAIPRVDKPGRTTAKVSPPRPAPVQAGSPTPLPLAGTGEPGAAPFEERKAVPAPGPANAAATPLTPEQILALNHLEEELERGGSRVNRALDPLRAWAEQDPAACAQWIMDNLDGAARRRSLEEAVAVWVSQAPPRTVLNWLETQEGIHPGAAMEGAYTLALSGFAAQDGFAAASWLESQPAHRSVANWESVFDGWIAQAPADAARWIASGHLSSELRDALAPNLLATFHDPADTSLILDSIGVPGRDDTLSRAARAASSSDPRFAMDLAAKIGDPTLRQAALDRTEARWLETDPAAARAYAAAHGLSLPDNNGGASTTGPGAMQEQPLATVDSNAPPEPPH